MQNRVAMSVLIIMVLFLSVSILSYSQQTQGPKTEEIVLTTYYPVPYGDYREMRAERMAVGKNWRSAANVCWEQGKCTDWINEEGTGGDTDLIVEGNAGIGSTYKPSTMVPNSEQGNLDVNDVYVRSKGQWVSQMGGNAFGVWEDYGYAQGTVYQAQTDGFLIGFSGGAFGYCVGRAIVYNGSGPNPPLMTAQGIKNPDDVDTNTFTIPVRKNDYWKVEQIGGCGWTYLYWLPVGK